MDTIHSHLLARSVAPLWLAAAASSLFMSADDWEVPYAVFSVLLFVASVATTLVIARQTSTPRGSSVGRVVAMVLAAGAIVTTIVAWAFVVWGIALAVGYAALALTGPRRARRVLWLSGALLAGVAVAVVGVAAKLGPAGQHNDHSDAQGWGITFACLLAAAALEVLARSEARQDVASAPA